MNPFVISLVQLEKNLITLPSHLVNHVDTRIDYEKPKAAETM